MEPRQAKALHIAATTALVAHDDGRWKVPSQSGQGTYQVAVGSDLAWSCTCPDFEERLAPCKHVMAVEITIQREGHAPGITYSETVKVKYTQNWPAYNKAQTNERDMVLRMLSQLCAGIAQPAQQGPGRRRANLSDLAFAHIHKTYEGLSARRFASDVRTAHDAGLISSAPAYNTIIRYGASDSMTPLLTDLVELSALPLKAIEQDFAVDSTGFGTSNSRTWFSLKHGREITAREWRKCHAIVGVKTNIVTACEITASNANDAPYLPDLVRTTAKNFEIREVSADKGYTSRGNADAIEAVGATPFIPFKRNNIEPVPGSAWARMWHMFSYRSEEFLASYHKRSNVETTFGMIKAKFGDSLLAKTETGQTNEVLAKVIAHNLCCLVHAFYELGIEADFAPSAA